MVLKGGKLEQLRRALANSITTISTSILFWHRLLPRSIHTSNRKYLIEASQFYGSIHERGYFATSAEPGKDEIDRLGRLKRRYILISIFLGHFGKAHRLSIGDLQMSKITSELLRRSVHIKFESIETEFSHVLVVTSNELSSRYCWVHLVLDSCIQQCNKRPIARVTLQGPSYFEFNAALASLVAHNRILVLVEWVGFDVSREDLLPLIQRGAHICLLSMERNTLEQTSDDPLVCKIIGISQELQ